MNETDKKLHNVVNDPTTSGHDRYTCTHCQCQVVRQPYMGDLFWDAVVERFKKGHAYDEPIEKD